MSNIVTINNTDLQVIEYRGQRVATLAQVDEVHERPEGTARRTFNDHKHRLVEGEDFFVCNTSEAKALGVTAPNGLVTMTERGYTMLVKPFTDDLAWEVQRKVVAGYFHGKEAITHIEKAKPRSDSTRYREAASITRDSLKICKLLGVDEGMAKTITAKEVRIATGLDFTPLLTNVTATDNPRLTVKELTERIGSGAKSEQVNAALEQLGFQDKKHWLSKGQPRSKWELTEAGKKYGALAPYQAEQNDHSGYRPVWHADVLPLVEPIVQAAIAQRAASAKPKARKAATPKEPVAA